MMVVSAISLIVYMITSIMNLINSISVFVK